MAKEPEKAPTKEESKGKIPPPGEATPGSLPGATPHAAPAPSSPGGAPGGRLDPLNASGSETPLKAAGPHEMTESNPVGGPVQSGPRSGPQPENPHRGGRSTPEYGPRPAHVLAVSEDGSDVTVSAVVDQFKAVVERFKGRDFWAAMREAGKLLVIAATAAEQQMVPRQAAQAPRPGESGTTSDPGIGRTMPDPHTAALSEFDKVAQEWERVKGECVAHAPQLAGGPHAQDWGRHGAAAGSPAPMGTAPARMAALDPASLLALLQVVSDAVAVFRKLFGR